MSASTVSRARIARRQAKSLGLRLIARGNIYELRDQHGETLVTGGLSAVENYLCERYIARAPGPAAARIPAAWAPLITEYCLSLAAGGQTAPTVRLRRLTLAHIARGLGAPPADITAEQLVAWFGRQTHWQPSTRRNYRSAARGFLSWAYRRGHVPRYLGDELPPVRDSVPLPRPVPDHIWRDALAKADPRVTVMLRLAAEAGLRRAEVAQIHTRDLIDDTAGASLLVHGKGGKTRIVPLNDSLAALVRAGARGHTPSMPAKGWLFPAVVKGVGEHISPGHVGQLVKRVLPEGYSMHKLRHRFATRAYRGTRNLRAVQTLLGHASIATTERYTAVDDDEIRATMLSAILA